MEDQNTLADLEEEKVRRITGRPLLPIRRVVRVDSEIVTVQFGDDAQAIYRINLDSESAIRV